MTGNPRLATGLGREERDGREERRRRNKEKKKVDRKKREVQKENGSSFMFRWPYRESIR